MGFGLNLSDRRQACRMILALRLAKQTSAIFARRHPGRPTGRGGLVRANG
jgi:hypothetical protein